MGKRWWQQYCEQNEAFGLSKQSRVSSVCASVFLHVYAQGCYLALTRLMDNEQALCRSHKEKKKYSSFWFSIKGLKDGVNNLLMVYGETD